MKHEKLKKLLPMFQEFLSCDTDPARIAKNSKNPPPKDEQRVGWIRGKGLTFGEAREIKAFLESLEEK